MIEKWPTDAVGESLPPMEEGEMKMNEEQNSIMFEGYVKSFTPGFVTQVRSFDILIQGVTTLTANHFLGELMKLGRCRITIEPLDTEEDGND